MTIRLFSDFDGPLIDVSERYYQVYLFCVEQLAEPGQEINILSKKQFWELKRNRVPEEQIAIQTGFRGDRTTEFARLRRDNVHSAPYFNYDRVQPTAISALTRLRDAGIELATMTMRRERELDLALEVFGLAEFFPLHLRYCLPNDYVKSGDTKDKSLLMARALEELPAASRTWMVGDTEADMVAGTSHNLTTIGVLSGIRNHTHLGLYQPTVILDTMADVSEWVLEELAIQAS